VEQLFRTPLSNKSRFGTVHSSFSRSRPHSTWAPLPACMRSGSRRSGSGSTVDGIIRDVDETTWKTSVLSSAIPVFVVFSANWCSHCKKILPRIEAAASSTTDGSYSALKLDVDMNPDVAGDLNIRSVPTIIAFVQGEPVDSTLGLLSETEIHDFIEKVMKMSCPPSPNLQSPTSASASDTSP